MWWDLRTSIQASHTDHMDIALIQSIIESNGFQQILGEQLLKLEVKYSVKGQDVGALLAMSSDKPRKLERNYFRDADESLLEVKRMFTLQSAKVANWDWDDVHII